MQEIRNKRTLNSKHFPLSDGQIEGHFHVGHIHYNQIHSVDNALDMLSTKLTIDSAETGSDTAATAAVINTSNDHVNTHDVIRIDVDAVSTTAAKGLIVTMGFQLP